MIKLEHITKAFGDRQVLRDITLTVEKGEIFGLIGKNGAGKTTLLSIIAGLADATEGACVIDGHTVGRSSRLHSVGYLPDVPAFFDFMSVNEFLEFLYQKAPGYKEKRDSLLKLVGLDGRTVIKTMSRGMRQRLGMAATLVNDPDVILLDEPSSALDPMGRYELSQILLQLREQGKTVVLSTHILTDMENICDRVGFLHNGTIVKTLAPGSVGQNQKLRLSFQKPVTPDIFDVSGLEIVAEDAHSLIIAGALENAPLQKALLQSLCKLDNPITAVSTLGADLDAVFREVCL